MGIERNKLINRDNIRSGTTGCFFSRSSGGTGKYLVPGRCTVEKWVEGQVDKGNFSFFANFKIKKSLV